MIWGLPGLVWEPPYPPCVHTHYIWGEGSSQVTHWFQFLVSGLLSSQGNHSRSFIPMVFFFDLWVYDGFCTKYFLLFRQSTNLVFIISDMVVRTFLWSERPVKYSFE